MKLVAVDIALTLLAGFTSWGAYFVVKPKFVLFGVDAALWIVGTLYLIAWIVLWLRKDVIMIRWLICTFIPAVLILMIPLFWIYWGTVYLWIILPIWLAIMGYFAKLVGEPWLDFKIVLRWVGVKKK